MYRRGFFLYLSFASRRFIEASLRRDRDNGYCGLVGKRGGKFSSQMVWMKGAIAVTSTRWFVRFSFTLGIEPLLRWPPPSGYHRKCTCVCQLHIPVLRLQFLIFAYWCKFFLYVLCDLCVKPLRKCRTYAFFAFCCVFMLLVRRNLRNAMRHCGHGKYVYLYHHIASIKNAVIAASFNEPLWLRARARSLHH